MNMEWIKLSISYEAKPFELLQHNIGIHEMRNI